MTGPVLAVKFNSASPCGQGVTPGMVLPYPETSVKVMPLTDVLPDMCVASMKLDEESKAPPSPSSKLLKA